MFGLWRRKKTDVYMHWYVLFPNFKSSTDPFYRKIEEDLRNREVPGMEISRIIFSEGGFITANREYLRLRRERFVFDICSAAFGTSWFFSCRFAEIPFRLRWWEVLVMLFLLFWVFSLYAAVFGLVWGSVIFLVSLISIVMLLNLTVGTGQRSLDDILLRIPVIGAFYELFLRRNLTYYREDSRLMYTTLVDAVAKTKVVDEAKTHGIEDVFFEYNVEPTSPRGLLDPLVDSLKAGVDRGLSAAGNLARKGLQKL